MLLVLMFLLLWGALVVMWTAALVSASRFSNEAFESAGRNRTLTIVLVAITGWLGGGYYWLVIKRELAASA